MKKYIRQWTIDSCYDPDTYYTVSLDYNGDLLCNCNEWAKDKTCLHTAHALLIMKRFERYLRALAMWKKAIMKNHIKGIWDEIYEIAKNIDIDTVQVAFKIAFGEAYEKATWRELKEMVTSLQFPWFSALAAPPVIDFQKFESRFNIKEFPLADIYDLFYHGEYGKVRFNTSCEEFLFVLEHRGKKYNPLLECLDCGDDDISDVLECPEESKPFKFAMLTPTIAVQIPTNLISAGR